MQPQSTPFTEARTVENPILKLLRTPELKKPFPTYELNENYPAKLDEVLPDAKTLDIEAMLAAELKI